MAFLDSIFKSIKKASKIAAEVKEISEENVDKSASVPPAPVTKSTAYEVVSPAKPSVCYSGTFHNNDEEIEFSFMISGDFVNVKSHAMEIDTAFIYEPEANGTNVKADFNKPYIFTSAGDETVYLLVEEFKETGTVDGLIEIYENRQILFKCKTDYYGETMVLYGMDRGDIWENCGIALVYNKDIEGTPLETKLIKILDEAAETYDENIINW